MPFNPFAAGPAEPVAEPADGGATRESDVDDGWWDFGSGPDAADATPDPDPADAAADDGRRDADGRGGQSEDAPDPMPDDGADDDWWGMASDAGGDDAPPARTARDPAGPAAHAGDDTDADDDWWGMAGGEAMPGPPAGIPARTGTDETPGMDADDDWWGMAGGDGLRSDDADPTPRLVSVPGTSVRIPADFDWGTDTPAAGPADGVREPAPAPARRPGPSRRILIAATAAILALALLAGGVVAARTLIASDRQRKAHDEACATLTAQAGTWDGLARQAKTLGVKPGDGPDTSCKADTDTLKARARTLARANRNALDAAWENLSGRIAASRKNHPKAGGQTLAALETLAETAPEDADGLAAKEREFERLDKQAGREQQQAEQEEKAEAEAKRKAEREAEARREAEAQDTPQAAAPTPTPMPQTTPTPAPQPTPTPTPTPAPGNADASM